MPQPLGRIVSAASLAALLAGTLLPSATFAANATASPPDLTLSDTGPGHYQHSGPNGEIDTDVCSLAVAAGVAHCDSHVRIDQGARAAKPSRSSGRQPAGTLGNSGAYDPSYLQSAYNLASAAADSGAGKTVAIVDAYDDPSAASDIAYYRSFFGLPAVPSFVKLNQSGVKGSYPASDKGWAQEESLDLDMVSAICPECNVMLVEANSASFGDLAAAVNTAAAHGASVISNSYGGTEFNGENSYDGAYSHPGMPVTASSGDNGYGAEYPAASPDVTAVGGTTLNQATNTGSRNATETVWSGAGSGCSAYESKPSWQTDSGCANRTVTDVSAVADPNTGVWVYDAGGWYIFGGTSVASPIISSVYALAGNPGSGVAAADPYAHASDLNDVTSGSNGSCGSYLCNGGPGYDGPSGLGTPNGMSGFTAAPVAQPPVVTGINPSSGPTAGGTSVTITGTNLTGATEVLFGSAAATNIGVNSAGTQITATSPAGSAGTVNVTVTTPVGTSATSSAGQFTYAAVAITGISPSSITASGNVTITLTGTGFTGATAVNVDSTDVTPTSVTDSQITFTAPAHAVGQVGVTVVTPAGTSAASQLTYTPSVTGLSSSSGAAGSSITVSGSGFSSGPPTVKFGANAGTSVAVASDSQLSVVVPSGTGTVDVTVTVAGISSPISSADQFVYSSPTFALSPASQSVTLKRGATQYANWTVTFENGFNSSVKMSASGAPSGVRLSWTPSSTVSTSGSKVTLNIRASWSAALVTNKPITVTASGGGVTQQATVMLTTTAASANSAPGSNATAGNAPMPGEPAQS